MSDSFEDMTDMFNRSGGKLSIGDFYEIGMQWWMFSVSASISIDIVHIIPSFLIWFAIRQFNRELNFQLFWLIFGIEFVIDLSRSYIFCIYYDSAYLYKVLFGGNKEDDDIR